MDTFFHIRSVASNVLSYTVYDRECVSFCLKYDNSGVLLIYSSWKKLKSTNGRIDIFDFFVHRIWRIWPAYLATIGIAIVLPLVGSGPLWPLSVESTATMCRLVISFKHPNRWEKTFHISRIKSAN